MKFKYIILSVIIMLALSIATLAVNPPEITGGVAIRAKEPMGLRVKAVIDSESALDESTLEYGFITTRKVFLSGNGISNEEFTLDCRAHYTKGVSKGVVDGENVDIFYDRDDTQVVFSGHMYGIGPQYYTDVIVARPYIITTDGNFYGTPVEMSLYDVAKSIKRNKELYDSLAEEQKAVVDSILLYVDGEPYEINTDDYRIVLSASLVKNSNPTYSISYDLYNPFTGETEMRVLGRMRTKDTALLSSMLPEKGALVPVYNGVVQDTTDGYMVLCDEDYALWVKSVDTEKGTMTFVPADSDLTCKECRDEYVSSYDGEINSLFGASFEEGNFIVAEDVHVTVMSDGKVVSSGIENVVAKEKELLCYNFKGEEKVYSDYVKAFAHIDEDGVCRYLVVVVNGDEKAALDEKCLQHTYFDVEFFVDGISVDKQSVKYGEVPELPEEPAKDGYTFLGWAESVNGEVTELNEVKSEKTYYAVFEINSFSVTFIVDGEEYEVQTVNYGEVPELPEAPAKDGYTFLGWAESDGGEVTELGEVKSEKTYYAVFEINSFSVTFIVDGEEYEVQVVNYGEVPELPEEPAKEGYTFLGWSEKVDGGVADLDEVKSEKTYYAVFEINSFSVTFMVDGEEYDVQTVNYGEVPELPEEPAKDGYTFLGWAESVNGEVTELNEVKSEKTYYAVFEINSFSVTFIVDGEEYEVQTVNYGEVPELPEAPAKDGYTFLGWAESDGGEVTDLGEIKGDKTYYAVFEINSFSVTFIVDGDEYDVQTVNYGEVPELPETPAKDGYTFKGWSESEDGKIVNAATLKIVDDKEYYAVFEAKTVKVRFIVGRNTHATQMVKIGSSAEVPAVPVLEDGNEFIGWIDVKFGTPENLVNIDEVVITEATDFYALFENNDKLIETMTKGRTQLLTKVRTSNALHKEAILLIAECMQKVIEDATAGSFVDKEFIYDKYPEYASSIKEVIKVKMDETVRGKFINLLTNTSYVSKDVQEFLKTYFKIDMSKLN